MQNVEFFQDPSPHIIIDEFLPPKLAKECLKEAIKLEPFYQDANVFGDTQFSQHLNDCKECQKEYEYNRNSIRENDIIYMDSKYEKQREYSIILKSLHNTIISEWFQNLVKNNGFWHILRHTTTSETILSRYGKCDFYGWHTDTNVNHSDARVVTLCYYFNKEPEEFEGGELILAGSDIHKGKKIQPKHNRAVIFQSESALHAVNTVKLLGDNFDGGRFSINFWLGFTGPWRYR